jgi:molecular chaperone DnaK
MASKASYVGIDLGTTNSAAAVFDGDQVHLIRNAAGSTLTPSVVRIDARGTVSVGARARRFLDSDPVNTRAEFKRLMGTRHEISFGASKQSKRPEELASFVLASLREDIREQLGFVPDRAVIAVPALFELPQSSATAEAARLAGFTQVELIQEPVASALAAGWSAENDASGAWLVYDLGGGTFDASLLETRDGLLRVVGHDGDNFLGGRDFDQAIVDYVLNEVEAESGQVISRGDAEHAVGLRRLKAAAEDAKIELSRAREAQISVPGAFNVDGASVDVDVVISRATLERLVGPLIDRSIAVCLRLLAAHGLGPEALHKAVLVGGPTVMPLLRQRVGALLGVAFADGLDPMTLVAQGAALYAATTGLDARAAAPKPAPKSASRLWLHHPAMSSDLFPHVAGRLVEAGPGGAPTEVRFVRDGWESPWAEIEADGGFVASLDLAPRRPNLFRVEARGADGRAVEVDPAEFTIVQGMTISDPPLSRSVGVALANDRVQVYLERGTPLPARRTFRHQTVEGIVRSGGDQPAVVLRIPIVQGELEQAHLCRLVGTLDIAGTDVRTALPAGTDVDVTVEVDRGGRLSARALVPSTGQVFEQVAHLLVPDAAPEVIESQLREMRTRLNAMKGSALAQQSGPAQQRVFDLEWRLSDAANDLVAAKGGDADAAQRSRRALLDIDGALADLEVDARWPELEEEARWTVAWTGSQVSMRGTPEEQRIAAEVTKAVELARRGRQAVELQRQIRLLRELGHAAYFRDPDSWKHAFERVASRIADATDARRAADLVKRGRDALSRGDDGEVRSVTQSLWGLMPSHDAESKRLGHDSGVR